MITSARTYFFTDLKEQKENYKMTERARNGIFKEKLHFSYLLSTLLAIYFIKR